MRFFVPTVDQMLTVTLPGESIRAPVIRIVDIKTVFVKLDSTPLNPAKSHSWRLGDVVAVRRKNGELGEVWEALDDRVLFARPAEVTEPPLPEKPKRAVRKKPAAVKRKRAKGGRGGRRTA